MNREILCTWATNIDESIKVQVVFGEAKNRLTLEFASVESANEFNDSVDKNASIGLLGTILTSYLQAFENFRK